MDEKDRIGDQCWYGVFKHPQQRVTEYRTGIVRAWSLRYCEVSEGHYPVAIVEDTETQACRAVDVNLISFAPNPPEWANVQS